MDFAQSRVDVGTGPVGYWGLSMGTIYGAPFVAAASNIDIPVLFIVQLEDELFNLEQCLEFRLHAGTTDAELIEEALTALLCS